jgi:acyl-CoA dehydrogenase
VTPIAPRSFGDLEFTGCEVDGQAVLGGSGTGFVVAMDTLERARVTVGAAALGFARRAAQAAVGHVRQRRIYGGRLLDLQLVKASLADIRISLEAMTLLVARAAWEADRDGPEFATHSSIAKAHATESAQRIVDAAVQLSGAAGLVAGSLPERLYRQVRSLRVYEGATEVQKMVIADATARWGPW